jgi:hypothetical protein
VELPDEELRVHLHERDEEEVNQGLVGHVRPGAADPDD